MPCINFKKQFAGVVENGLKTQTIRKIRKRPIRIGDTLQLYTGMRTKKCRKLMTAVAIDIKTIVIDQTIVMIDGNQIDSYDVGRLARADGFHSICEFKDFFNSHYGLPFVGQLINWRPL